MKKGYKQLLAEANAVIETVPVAEAEPAPEVDEEGIPIRPQTPEAKPEEDLLLKKAIEVLTSGTAKTAAVSVSTK